MPLTLGNPCHTMGYRVPCHARSVACEYLEAKLEISREWQTSAPLFMLAWQFPAEMLGNSGLETLVDPIQSPVDLICRELLMGEGIFMSNRRLKGLSFLLLLLIYRRERDRMSVCSFFRQGRVRSRGDQPIINRPDRPITLIRLSPDLEKKALQVRIHHQNAGRLSGSAYFFFHFNLLFPF